MPLETSYEWKRAGNPIQYRLHRYEANCGFHWDEGQESWANLPLSIEAQGHRACLTLRLGHSKENASLSPRWAWKAFVTSKISLLTGRRARMWRGSPYVVQEYRDGWSLRSLRKILQHPSSSPKPEAILEEFADCNTLKITLVTKKPKPNSTPD